MFTVQALDFVLMLVWYSWYSTVLSFEV